jgi:hypothetical protein
LKPLHSSWRRSILTRTGVAGSCRCRSQNRSSVASIPACCCCWEQSASCSGQLRLWYPSVGSLG